MKTTLNKIKVTTLLALIIFIMLISVKCHSQDKVTFGVTQDVRLALSDDNAGNKAYTPDIIFNMDWECAQFGNFYPALKMQYEYADLHGGTFTKYTVSGGITCNKISMFGYDYPNLEVGLFLGGGVLARPSISHMPDQGVYSIIIEASYKIFKGFRGVLKYEMNNAPDLNYLYKDNTIRHNVSAGIEINLIKT